MTLPDFDATKHAIGINGKGFMVAPDGAIVKQDFVPATSRAAQGEGRFDSFQSESFAAQSEFGGGAGQQRLSANDSYGSGLGDGRWGRFFPPKKALTESDGGTTSYFVNRDTTLYGLTASAIETIGTATSQARTAGTVRCKPVTSGNQNAFWVQDVSGANALMKWTGSGAPTNVTPRNITPYLVSRYGKWMWLLGKRVRPAVPNIVQSITIPKTGTKSANVSWTQMFTSGNLALVALFHDPSAVVTPLDPLWQVVDTSGNWTILSIEGAQSRPGSERFDLSVDRDVTGVLLEVEGITTQGALDAVVVGDGSPSSVSVSSVTIGGPSTGTLSQAKNFILSVYDLYRDAGQISGTTVGTGFTELADASRQDPSPSNQVRWGVVASRVVSATASVQNQIVVSVSNVSTTPNDLNWNSVILAFKGVPYSEALDQFTVHYTEDDGASWIDASPLISTGIGAPIAALAAQGFLWFTTATGLYQMAAEEHTYEDHTSEVIVGIRGPLDQWSVPYDTAAVGTHLATYEGLFYYNVGATARQYAPGGTGRQIWPPPDWGTVVGKVQALTAGEGGVYFSAAGYLWCYNTRGFTPLAKEPVAGAFDTLYWHQGRLYVRGDPARYLDFRYPGSRPDITFSDATTFETGYMVTSEMDFEKVSVPKVIRNLEVQGYFVNGGSLSLHYTTGCDGVIDPLPQGGGATASDWTLVGSMTSADGGSKAFTLPTPLVCKRLYLRVTLSPDATGYPVLQAFTAYGRTVMPSSVRLTASLTLTTGTRDHTGTVMYPTPAAVQEAVQFITDLREATTLNYFTVTYVNPDGTTTDYLVTAEAQTDTLRMRHNATGADARIDFAMAEIPQ